MEPSEASITELSVEVLVDTIKDSTEVSEDVPESIEDVDQLANVDLNKLFAKLLGAGLVSDTNYFNLQDAEHEDGKVQFTTGFPTGGGTVHNIFNISPVMTNQVGGPVPDGQLEIETSDDPNVPPEIKLKSAQSSEIIHQDHIPKYGEEKKVDRQLHRLQDQIDGLHEMKYGLEEELEYLKKLAKQERQHLDHLQQNGTDPFPSSVILNSRHRRI